MNGQRMRIIEISLVEVPIHPEWRIVSIDGKPNVQDMQQGS
jgi:hypothetical protein